MFKADNSSQLLIGKAISRTASVQITDPSTTATYIADGEILVLDENDNVLAPGTTFGTSRYIKIVQRSSTGGVGDVLIQSDRIDGSNVLAFSGRSYVAPQEQIWSFGFNGTSGSIDNSGVDDYVMRLTFKEDKTIWSHYSNTRIFRYEPDSTNTQKEVADYFAQVSSEDAFSASEVKIERLINATTGTDAANFTFTNGSKVAVASAAATVVVGDYIKAGTGVTQASYRVVSISGLNYTLDQKFQGSSATATTPDYVLAATAATADFGVRFTGKAQSFTVGKFKFVKVMFEFSLSGFGTTTVSKTQESGRGSGTYQEVSELEWFTYGFEGAVDRFTESSPTIKADASSSAIYDILAIEYFANFDTFPVSGAKPARKLLLIAIVDGASQATNVLAQLNPWMASTPRAFAPAVI